MSRNGKYILLIGLLLSGTSPCWAETAPSTIVPETSRISDDQARVALVQALLKTPSGRQEALVQLKKLQSNSQSMSQLIRDLAWSYAAIGHYQTVYALAKEWPADSVENPKLSIEHAFLWGDFYSAEAYWSERLKHNPNDVNSALRLASALIEAERTSEAEELYRALWQRPPHPPSAALGLTRAYLLQKQFSKAETFARELQGLPNIPRETTRLLGEALLAQDKLPDAEAVFGSLTESTEATAEDWTRLGVVHQKLDEQEEAKACFRKALEHDPKQVEAAYRLAGKAVDSDDFMKELFSRELDASQLVQWANWYTADNLYARALTCYRQANKIDADCFPAAEGRAFVLAISGNHDEAEKEFRALIALFPESARLHIRLARTLAWSRQYDKALDLYDTLIKGHKHDLLLQREAARVALWAKRYDDAMDRYDRILNNTPTDSAYQSLLKRAITAERDYKRLLWRHRYVQALQEVNILIELMPGDQEAVFDRAQIHCILGLCDLARSDYQHLLQLNVMHSIVSEALELARLDSRPSLQLSGSYWREDGHGDLSDIHRYTTAVGVTVPIYCRADLFVESRRWFEFPGDYNGRIDAWTYTAGLRASLNAFLKAEISGTFKQYEQTRFTDTYTGQAKLWANLYDYAQLGVGYGRADELYNRFGYFQKTQSDNTWVELRSDLTRRWDALLRLKDTHYNDSNKGYSIFLNTGYDITDHPRILKLSASAEYRDTDEDNQYIYNAGRLVNIIHPYWAPKNYVAGFLTLEWWHDLSGPHQYCGNRRHFYDLKASVGTDTESNPGITLEAEWQYRFTNRWSLGLTAYTHYSEDWNAQGLWLSLGCQL
jgi:tetratricopeptide (TPR) repeat protein